KLAYAQFEELETFARFGARLDEDTRQSIVHGQRIRACLGLALVQRVSQWHGGQVLVQDSEWGGASFRMRWAYDA
ncbi:hypothetical protein L9Z73_25175, partial [Pseudomonas sp. TNT11]